MHRHELTEEQWARVAPLLPAESGRPGRPVELPNRSFMNAIFYIAKTGVQWRDLPERFGSWKTVHNRFSRWNAKGIFQRVLDEFAKDADHESNMVDGTYARAHQDAAGAKGGPKTRLLDALAVALPPKFTLSLTVSVIRSTSTSRLATSTTSSRLPSSSRRPKAKTLSEIKATTQTQSLPLSKRKE